MAVPTLTRNKHSMTAKNVAGHGYECRVNDNLTTTTSDNGTYERDEHSLQTYLSHMLALERHMAQPLAQQAKFDDATAFGSAMAIIGRLRTTTDAHIAALEQRLDALGGHPGSGIKSAWASFLGSAAAAMDSMRKTRVSKSLRDDYAALALATMGYTMLDATALALNDAPTANLAKRHLTDYAKIVMDIGLGMPDIVLQELQETGLPLDATVAGIARNDALNAWRSGAASDQAPQPPLGIRAERA